MSTLTDEQLTALLRRSFTEHEQLAGDNAVARLTATPPVPRRSRRRGLTWLAAAAAAAAVVVGTVTLTPWPGSVWLPGDRSATGSATGSATSSHPSTAPATTTDVAREAATAAYLEQLLAQAPTGPGWQVRAPGSFRASLASGSGNRLTRTRWYAAPARSAEVLAWVKAHPPAWSVGPPGSGTSTLDDATVLTSVQWTDPVATDERTGVDLIYSVVAAGSSESIVRVDVESSWRPVRTPALYVDPATVTGADLTVTSLAPNGSREGDVRSGSVSAADIRLAVGLLNAQRARVPELVHSCPVPVPRRAILVLHTTTGDVTIDVNPWCSGSITVTRGGTEQRPALEGHEHLYEILKVLADRLAAGPVSAT